MRHYNRQESIHVAIEKREGQERSEERDMSIKERRNRGPKLKMEGIYLGRKKERRRAKSEKWQTRGGVKIPSSSPDPLWAWLHIPLPQPSSPPLAVAAARPAWRRATVPPAHPPSPPSPETLATPVRTGAVGSAISNRVTRWESWDAPMTHFDHRDNSIASPDQLPHFIRA